MKVANWISGALIVALWMPLVSMGAEGARSFQLHNRLRVEYDDNIRDEETNKDASWKIIEELELLVNFNLENTFISFRYKPAFVWWDNRPEEDTDLHHDFDFIFNHTFSPRLSLSIKDTLRYAELPEQIDTGVVLRERSDYLYNALNGTLAYQVRPQSRLEFSGRYNLLRYDESDVGDLEDYDMLVAGITVRHNVLPETALLLDTRYEDISYEKYDAYDRGSASSQIGLGAEHMFSPNLLGNMRFGYHYKDFNDNDLSSSSEPYADLSMTFIPSPATRLTLGAGYSMLEADIFPFASQDRTRVFVGMAHDVTARISVNLVGSYIHSSYDADQALAVEGYNVEDGSEDAIQVSARTTYRINRTNWLEAGWQFITLDSDLRQDYDRNRISLGWKTQL